LESNSSRPIKEQAQFYLATINLKNGNYSDGRHNFNIFIQDFPESSLLNRARLGIADTYFFEGNYSLAEKIYEELLAIKDERVASIVYARLIDLNSKQGKREKAQDYLNRLHSEYPLGLEAGSIKALPVRIEKETQKEINPPSEIQPPSGFFSVQVGAFAEREKADKLCKELVNRGEDAYVILLETTVGQSLYRVRVGRLSSAGEAEALAKRLASQGYPTKVIP
jgi:tetratricopeptide (TPR) repeat protein